MTEFTEQQEAEIQKRIEEAVKKATLLEQWTIAEDTIKRDIEISTERHIAAGEWHPFMRKVAVTMYSASIVGRVPVEQAPPEKPEEPEKGDE